MGRSICCSLILTLGGCAILQPPKPPPPPPEMVEEDEDAGVEAITRTLREARKHLSVKQFQDATRMVVRAERAVKRATDVTRAHPDFDDTAAAVTSAREKLEAAIEEDRIERREAAIDDLIRRAETATRQGETLRRELEGRVPSREDIAALEEIVGALREMRDEGGQFLSEARYKSHAATRDERAEVLVARLAQARWQLDAASRIGQHVDAAHAAVSVVKTATTSAARIVAFQKAASAFTTCVNTIAELEDEAEYDGRRLIETRLGRHSLAKTRRLCTDRSTRARKEGYKLDWHNRVLEVVASLAEPLPRVRAGGRATAALGASEEALDVLSSCEATLKETARHPGADGRKAFETVLGKLNAEQLRAACAAERVRLSRALPGLEWRGALEKVGDRLDETKLQIDQVDTVRDPADRIRRWQSIIGDLKECGEQAQQLARERHAEKSFAVTTRFGRLTAASMKAECDKQIGLANKQVQLATKEVELAGFLATCSGDEVAVARREGIPSRVENVPGGRIFMYDKTGRKGVARSFGFDTTGKRVDFRRRWLNQVGTVVSEVNRAMQAILRAPTGSEALKATEAALPVLNRCVDALADSDKAPGYNGSAVFTTSLGKVPALRLGELCAAERVRRAGSIVGIEWRIRLELLRDRVGEAQTELERGRAARNTATRIERLGAGIGGFEECLERAESLEKADGSNAKLEVSTAGGPKNLRALAQSCETLLKTARKELDNALADKANAKFVSSCRGDEAEVARRRGIPTRIEKRVGGRVFVYETIKGRKKKVKRFAFNNEGKRVDEKTLGANRAPALEAIPGANGSRK
jgi:hypothetical protein